MAIPKPLTQKSRATPPHPQTPEPWKWKCHKCGTRYRLSCTRRCLRCSHLFCIQPISLIPDSEEQGQSSTTPDDPEVTHNNPKRRRICASEFDFNGWAAWGSFKRSSVYQALGGETYPATFDAFASHVPVTSTSTRPSERRVGKEYTSTTTSWVTVSDAELEDVLQRKENMYANQKHNCWVHCDYPSECRYNLAQSLGKRKREAEDNGHDKDNEDEEAQQCEPYDAPIEGTCWDPAAPDPIDFASKSMSDEAEEEEKNFDYDAVYAQEKTDDETACEEIESFSVFVEDAASCDDEGSKLALASTEYLLGQDEVDKDGDEEGNAEEEDGPGEDRVDVVSQEDANQEEDANQKLNGDTEDGKGEGCS